MTNKCPNCGFVYNDGDIFCSRCGVKLDSEKKPDIKSAIAQFEYKYKRNLKNKAAFSSQKVKKIIDSPAVTMLLLLLFLFGALCISLYFVLNIHHEQKEVLQYKNLMQNPSQIPLLKEGTSYEELADSINQVESFLSLYLKNSEDNVEKKEQIFSLYLKQLEKLPNVLSREYNFKNSELCSDMNAQNCAKVLNNLFKYSSINVYLNNDLIILYPDYEFIKENYAKYFSSDFISYLKLRAKYNYPVDFGLDLNIKPRILAKKVIDFEKLYNKATNEFVKEEAEKILYHDFRKLIFTPSIYATTTNEMKPKFKKTYIEFIKKYKKSNLRPVVMSYMDKKRAYNETNFKNDYPYKNFNFDTFNQNVKNSVFEDVFVQLRKNIFADNNAQLSLAFVYDITNGKWKKYSSDGLLNSSEYVLSEPDENNNVSIYNSAFSPVQELNILKYSKMYLISDGLYVFNKDKLIISKVTFNGKTFNLYTLNHVDVTSLFPGIEVVNIDSFSSYNVIIDKHNAKANYILLSRYSQGWNDYDLIAQKGEINQQALPNMFNINSQNDVVVTFVSKENTQEEFSENKPSYKMTFHTIGNKEVQDVQKDIVQYDKAVQDDTSEEHKPNIMPKLPGHEEKVELENDNLLVVPQQKIDPPDDND